MSVLCFEETWKARKEGKAILTKKEKHEIERLKHENRHLKDQIEKHMKIYREQLYEIVAMRSRYDLMNKLATQMIELGAYGSSDAYSEMPNPGDLP